jgi:hypothetical protein
MFTFFLLAIIVPLSVLNGYIKAIHWQLSIMNNQSKTTFVVLAAAVAALFMASTMLVRTTGAAASVEELAEEKVKGPKKKLAELAEEKVKGDRTGAVRSLASEPEKQLAEEKVKGPKKRVAREILAPIAISGNNVYITWWSNKTGNDEVMFRASTDNGVTFGNKINLSNTTQADSQDAEIAASGNKVYVTWWERNQTSEEPVLRVSNDNGETFGPILKLASNGTTIGGGG